MKVNNGIFLTKKVSDGRLIFSVNDEVLNIEASNINFGEWDKFYKSLISYSPERRENWYNEIKDTPTFKALVMATKEGVSVKEIDSSTPAPTPKPTLVLKQTLQKLINFFKEFEFEPNFRFVNTLAYKTKEGLEEAQKYVTNYFRLVDNQYKTEIANKITSMEFAEILSTLQKVAAPTSPINNRLKVYYGSAGTGKTTLAMKESDNRCVVCNASMLPSDLMEDFVFQNGQPAFQKSKLWNCMENGEKIVLDEINLLPFDSLRFLQGILDGKKEFNYKGYVVNIKDGFQVIGTMNLSIGGMIYGLPEPLIDRCADMKEFILSADQLLGAVFEE